VRLGEIKDIFKPLVETLCAAINALSTPQAVILAGSLLTLSLTTSDSKDLVITYQVAHSLNVVRFNTQIYTSRKDVAFQTQLLYPLAL
jgi:hypothetical protein